MGISASKKVAPVNYTTAQSPTELRHGRKWRRLTPMPAPGCVCACKCGCQAAEAAFQAAVETPASAPSWCSQGHGGPGEAHVFRVVGDASDDGSQAKSWNSTSSSAASARTTTSRHAITAAKLDAARKGKGEAKAGRSAAHTQAQQAAGDYISTIRTMASTAGLGELDVVDAICRSGLLTTLNLSADTIREPFLSGFYDGLGGTGTCGENRATAARGLAMAVDGSTLQAGGAGPGAATPPLDASAGVPLLWKWWAETAAAGGLGSTLGGTAMSQLDWSSLPGAAAYGDQPGTRDGATAGGAGDDRSGGADSGLGGEDEDEDADTDFEAAALGLRVAPGGMAFDIDTIVASRTAEALGPLCRTTTLAAGKATLLSPAATSRTRASLGGLAFDISFAPGKRLPRRLQMLARAQSGTKVRVEERWIQGWGEAVADRPRGANHLGRHRAAAVVA